MNHEEQFARRIVHLLDHSPLTPEVTERLRAARERALMQQSVALKTHTVLGRGGAAVLGGDNEGHAHPLRHLLALLTLVLCMVFAYYWNNYAQTEMNEEVDSALLADDLSPKAYLDPGFQAWVSHYAQESVR